MPGENIMKLGEQWEIEMPGFGKMTVRNNKNKITNTNKKTKQNEQKTNKGKSGRLKCLDSER